MVSWTRYQTEVSNEYPLLAPLQEDHPHLVRAARRELAEARICADEEARKRAANPHYASSRAYQRSCRRLARAERKGREALVALAVAAGLDARHLGIIPDGPASAPDSPTEAPRGLKEGFLRQIRSWDGTVHSVPPHRHLLAPLATATDRLPDDECVRLGLAPGSTLANAARKAQSLPGHVVYDLHGYRINEAVEYAGRRLREAWEHGLGYVTVIHGSPDVTRRDEVLSMVKGGIKWSLRDLWHRGEWDQYVYPDPSAHHENHEGRMTLMVRRRPNGPGAGSQSHPIGAESTTAGGQLLLHHEESMSCCSQPG